MKKKLVLTASLLFMTSSPVFADDVKTVTNEISQVQKQLHKAQEEEENRSWWDNVVAYFTTSADEETKVEKLEKKLDKLKHQEKNLKTKSLSQQVNDLNQTSQHNMETKKQAALKAKEEARKAEEAKKAEEIRKAEEAKKAAEAKKAEEAKKAQTTQKAETTVNSIPSTDRAVKFGSDGLLVMEATQRAQSVINQMSNGTGHVAHTPQLDAEIDALTAAEAVYVMYKIEGPGFGQTGSGHAGYDSPESHKAFVELQLNNRFHGSIHELLKLWGTFPYGGY